MNEYLIGQIVYGDFSRITIRVKNDKKIEIGEILSVKDRKTSKKYLYKVVDLKYSSELSKEALEMISGLNLENEDIEGVIKNEKSRNYIIAELIPLLKLEKKPSHTKEMPSILSNVYRVREKDFSFIKPIEKGLYFGNIRSGSRVLEIPIELDSEKVLNHHIFISATTGRGKSNFLKNLLWNSLYLDNTSFIIFDPHDEYYGRKETALKDHPYSKENLIYYSTSPLIETNNRSLIFNIETIKPWHFAGILNFSEPQREVMEAYYTQYGDEWILKLLKRSPLPKEVRFHEMSIDVVMRKLRHTLSIYRIAGSGLSKPEKQTEHEHDSEFEYRGIFKKNSGKSTIKDIIKHVIDGKKIIIDTSSLPNDVEILISSIISTEIFSRYKKEKTLRQEGLIKYNLPNVSIVLEEAPRVLGKDIISKGGNIFSTIAREGRKFKVGLVAITQLPSLIPKDILANLNTKIILGLEMAQERQALINSSSQDLTHDEKSISSLDKGEAIISSIFSMFAIPVKIPYFIDYINQDPKYIQKKEKKDIKKEFTGINIM